MFYFGRIISAFFNQLFRFLFNNRLGQKILIIIIISLIAFWCLNMTEVHAVEEVTDINYEVNSYYDYLVSDFILRFNNALNNDNTYAKNLLNYINEGQNFYLFYQNSNSYNNSYPTIKNYLKVIIGDMGSIVSNSTITANDYMGVTGYTMYQSSYIHRTYNFISNGNVEYSYNSNGVETFYFPLQLFGRRNDLFTTYINAINNNDNDTIISLLEDIKAEQQATNDFLTDDTMDETNIDIPSPVLDTTTQDTDTSIHNSINTLTSSLQNTITNYYERLGCLRLGNTYAEFCWW